MLIGDLREKLEDPGWRSPGQFDGMWAGFLWDEPRLNWLPPSHESASLKDIKYRLSTNIGSEVLQSTTVKFIWKEVFIPQEGEGGKTDVKWFAEGGFPVNSGSHPGEFATAVRELSHPEIPGTIIPDYNRNGISAPDELAALNLGEKSILSNSIPNSPGIEKTVWTIHRGKPITFQVDLADQKSNPTLTATGSGAVTLWECKKDGKWKEHSLPFRIPAEQSAGPSSDPGSYMIQGTDAGDVTLQITVNGSVRDESVIHVRRIDLDVDSDNSGQVAQSKDEEEIEEDSNQPGKILPGGDAMDSDANGIPLHPEKLTSLKLQTANLPSWATITFRYPDKALRIWKTPPGQSPASGDLLVPGYSYAPADLEISPGSTSEFSVQAIGTGLGLVRIGVSCAGAEDGVLVNLPIKVIDNAFATGVDDVSCTAESTDPGYQADTWIMAPSGTVPGTASPCANDTIFKISPSAGFKLHVAAPAAGQFTTTPGSFPAEGQALGPGGWPVVSWHGDSGVTADLTPDWTVTPTEGSPATITLPLKVKVMKRRTVKVKVYLVAEDREDLDPLGPDPDMVPTEDELKDHLNPLFACQVNTWFHVRLEEGVFMADWGNDLDVASATTSLTPDQITIINACGGVDPDAHIHIFIIGSNAGLGAEGDKGVTHVAGATCWISGGKFAGYQTKQHVLETIGHEIGHIFFGIGHPDEELPIPQGPAPLKGTHRANRLMCKGASFNSNSRLIVKAEWDAAERWLKLAENQLPMEP